MTWARCNTSPAAARGSPARRPDRKCALGAPSGYAVQWMRAVLATVFALGMCGVCSIGWAGAVGAGASGAPAGTPTSPPTGVVRSAIIAGSASPEVHDAVVVLAHEEASGAWQFTCTATLIAPNLLVTARHCLSVIDSPNVACDGSGKQVAGGSLGADRVPGAFAVYMGPTRPASGKSKSAARGKRIVHDGSTTLCGHDLAFLVLDRDVSKTAILPVRLDRAPAPGESVVAVGYGIDRAGVNPEVRQERAVPVRLVGPFAGTNEDPPVAPGDFLVGESFCQGDSGGPALARSSDAVVGVATRVGKGSTTKGGNDCVAGSSGDPVYAFYTQIAAFSPVAKQAFAAAGRAPWLEGEDPPWWTFDDGGCACQLPGAQSTRSNSPSLSAACAAMLAAITVARRSRSRWHRDRTRD